MTPFQPDENHLPSHTMKVYRNCLKIAIALTGIYIVGVFASAAGIWNGRIPLPVQLEVRVQPDR